MMRQRWVRIGCAIALSWQAAVMAQPRVLEPGVEWLPGRLATGVNKPLTQAQIHLSPQDLASASGAEPGTCSKRPIT
jgi:hypothetical protein